MGKVSTLSHFLLELGCEIYSVLDQAVADFEHGFDSILRPIKTPELNAYFDEPDIMVSLVSSGFDVQ